MPRPIMNEVGAFILYIYVILIKLWVSLTCKVCLFYNQQDAHFLNEKWQYRFLSEWNCLKIHR